MSHNAITIDTFQYAKDLKKAGFTEIQVETHVKYAKEQANNISELIHDDIATKKDLKESEKILELKIAQMGYKTIIGLGSMLAISVTVLGLLINQI